MHFSLFTVLSGLAVLAISSVNASPAENLQRGVPSEDVSGLNTNILPTEDVRYIASCCDNDDVSLTFHANK